MQISTILSVALITGGALLSNVAQADQLCHDNGDLPPSGCMNITWECGTFTVNDGQICVSTIVAPNAEIKKEVGHSGGSYEIGDFEAEIADMQKKKGVARVQPDGSEPLKAGKCPPVCAPVVIQTPVPVE